MLLNNSHVRDLAATFAARVIDLQPGALSDQIDLVYQLAFSRLPSRAERELGMETLNTLQSITPGSANAPMETYCHTILNSAAFLYID